MRGLYIHIPFCKKVCSYCDFPKIVAKNEEEQNEYITALIKEIEDNKNELKNIKTVYIGGGTPNALSLNLLEKLFIKIDKYLKKSIENTIELNPELVTVELCDLLNKYHFNRVSLGVQTIKNDSIDLLNRRHKKEDVINAINMLKHSNINNINIDLMFGIPKTNLEDVKNDIDFVISLDITHISYYSLILEDKTIFKHLYNNKELELLDDDLIADMYDYINNKLEQNGFKHYEISNYAKNGYESVHNKLYWNTNEYVGVGCGAAGYIKPYRYSNHRILSRYLKYREEERSFIDIHDEKQEFMMLGLRLCDGVSITEYKNRFNSNVFDDFDLDKIINKNLIEIENDYIKIKKDKLFIANIVFEEFVGE